MVFYRVCLLCFFISICNASYSQVEFELASLDDFDGLLASQRDCVVDMNGDYLDDIVISIANGLVVYYQHADGHFESIEYPIPGFLNSSWNILGSDFNKDGLTDICVGNDKDFSILMSDRLTGGFNKTIMPDEYFVQRSSSIDLDLDGDLDIFSCNDIAINQVFENLGDSVLVRNIDLLPTVDLAGNYSHLWCDYDNDGDQDLQISKCYANASSVDDPERINLFYQNNGDGSYSEIGESINMNDNAQSWVASMEDFDNDGDFDAFIANHDFANRFMLNDGNGNFTDIIGQTNIDTADLGALESFAFDFDNNGFIDILLDSKKRIWLNNGDLTFTPMAIPMFMFFNSAMGDLNNDGFIDILIGSKLWLNTTNDNNWVKINTKGIESNIHGIASRVEIYGEWGMQSREIRAGHSFSTMSTLNTHFGLGSATEIDSIVVKWPSGVISTKINPGINQAHLIHEYECIAPNISLINETEISICAGNVFSAEVPAIYNNVVWNDGSEGPNIDIQTAGIYYATMLDANGCFVQSESFNVTIVEDVTPIIFPNEAFEICKGDTIILSATVEQGEFTWNTGATTESIEVYESGSYFVEATSLCTSELISSEITEIMVAEAPLPIISDVIIGEGENVTLIAQGENILWYSAPVGGNVIQIGPEFTTPFLTMDATYYVTNSIFTENFNECMTERIPVNVFITGVEEVLIELGIEVYPNPAESFIQIDLESVEKVNKISLIDPLGKVILSLEEIENNHQINLQNIPSGNYNLVFETNEGSFGKKIVVLK